MLKIQILTYIFCVYFVDTITTCVSLHTQEFICYVLKNEFGGGHLGEKFNLENFDKRGHSSYDIR